MCRAAMLASRHAEAGRRACRCRPGGRSRLEKAPTLMVGALRRAYVRLHAPGLCSSRTSRTSSVAVLSQEHAKDALHRRAAHRARRVGRHLPGACVAHALVHRPAMQQAGVCGRRKAHHALPALAPRRLRRHQRSQSRRRVHTGRGRRRRCHRSGGLCVAERCKLRAVVPLRWTRFVIAPHQHSFHGHRHACGERQQACGRQ
mmetsp:Transcript_26984/g.80017  ORF Transcript_26984/g.80017 Transcript_26984/m.80017 type:complete len:202 (+) Transcript_26984:370-975(+)